MGGCMPKNKNRVQHAPPPEESKCEEKPNFPEFTLPLDILPQKSPLITVSDPSMIISIASIKSNHPIAPKTLPPLQPMGQRRLSNLIAIARTPDKLRELTPLPPIRPNATPAKRFHSTQPPTLISPFSRNPGPNRNSLLSIPMRVVTKNEKQMPEDLKSKSSEQFSDGSSSSNSRADLSFKNSPMDDLSPTGNNLDRKISEHFVAISTHVKRTSVVNKEKLVEGGRKINQYKIIGKLGRGAFGKVFKGIDDSGKLVAIKVYNKRIMMSRWIGKGRTAWNLVASEIEILQSTNHPRLISLYEVINQEGYHKIYLVLEYAAKGTLDSKGKVSENIARKYFRQLIEGIGYVHEVIKVVHRDIKPQNILFDAEDNLKISDFGSAQYLQLGRDELTSSAGTYAFMAPELHSGNKVIKGKPTDIWAAGITLYFMVEGKTPFNSKKIHELMNEVKHLTIVLPAHFSQELRDLLSCMLDKDPDRRIDIKGIKKSSWFNLESE